MLALFPAGFTPLEQTGVAYYIVKEGDTLWEIAARFDISVEDLVESNSLSDASRLSPGDHLRIPGLRGFQGEVDTITVNYGESMTSISRRFQVPRDKLVLLNHLTSPRELFVGAEIVVPAEFSEPVDRSRLWIEPGSTLLELAVSNNQNPWSLIIDNDLGGSWGGLPNDVLTIAGDAPDRPGALPEIIENIEITLPVVQGKTFFMKVQTGSKLDLGGSLNGRELRFFPVEGGFVALQGIHAMLESGFYPLTLEIRYPDDETKPDNAFSYSQWLYIRDGGYPNDPPLSVPPETLDPDVTEPEDKLWASLGEPFTDEKMWDGVFASPVPDEYRGCWTSTFGNRRSYNGGPYDRYHSGLDFCGGTGTGLYAPAAGKVVFAGTLTVRGNATVIDHGWGIYTAYAHQSEIFVKPGDMVQPGERIGLGGETGRVTGPHLHWEVWVGGVQVDPADWLVNWYP